MSVKLEPQKSADAPGPGFVPTYTTVTAVHRPRSLFTEEIMAVAAYRLNNPVTVVLQQADHLRLIELCVGSVVASGSKPDANGLIDGTCGENVVLMFARDLESRAERIAAASGSLWIEGRENVRQP